MEKHDDLNLIALEIMMLECAEEDDYITESGIVDMGRKILNDLQKLIDHMIQFAKDITTDLAVLAGKTAMKAKLNLLKIKAKNGESISIPDFKKIETIYGNACDVLPRELRKLLKSAYPIRTSSDLARFQEKKMRFENQLIDLEHSLEEITHSTKVYKADVAYQIIDGLLHQNSIYVNSYYKAIREFGRFKNEYEKILKEASRKNDGLGKKSLAMHKSLVAKTSTSLSRMMKKAIFLVSAIVV